MKVPEISNIALNEYPPHPSQLPQKRNKKNKTIEAIVASIDWRDPSIYLDVRGSIIPLPLPENRFYPIGSMVTLIYEGTLNRSTFSPIGIE